MHIHTYIYIHASRSRSAGSDVVRVQPYLHICIYIHIYTYIYKYIRRSRSAGSDVVRVQPRALSVIRPSWSRFHDSYSPLFGCCHVRLFWILLYLSFFSFFFVSCIRVHGQFLALGPLRIDSMTLILHSLAVAMCLYFGIYFVCYRVSKFFVGLTCKIPQTFPCIRPSRSRFHDSYPPLLGC